MVQGRVRGGIVHARAEAERIGVEHGIMRVNHRTHRLIVRRPARGVSVQQGRPHVRLFKLQMLLLLLLHGGHAHRLLVCFAAARWLLWRVRARVKLLGRVIAVQLVGRGVGQLVLRVLIGVVEHGAGVFDVVFLFELIHVFLERTWVVRGGRRPGAHPCTGWASIDRLVGHAVLTAGRAARDDAGAAAVVRWRSRPLRWRVNSRGLRLLL